MNHWALKYLGEPWSQEMDCWGWFRKVQREQYAIYVPPIDIDSLSLRQVLITFDTHPERANWLLVDAPAEGDAVLMGRSANPLHVGIWLADHRRVFHCEQNSGVLLQSLTSLKLHNWSHIRFYRHASHLST